MSMFDLKVTNMCNSGGFDWNLFSKEYRDHPYFTIDDACSQEVTVPSTTDEIVVPVVDTPPFRWHWFLYYYICFSQLHSDAFILTEKLLKICIKFLNYTERSQMKSLHTRTWWRERKICRCSLMAWQNFKPLLRIWGSIFQITLEVYQNLVK